MSSARTVHILVRRANLRPALPNLRSRRLTASSLTALSPTAQRTFTYTMLGAAMGVELPRFAVQALPVVVGVVTGAYYLLWKYAVRFLNEVLEIA